MAGRKQKVILDFGCGPGHDLVGFSHYSKPARLVAMDVSQSSLIEAQNRSKLHNFQAEYFLLEENKLPLPLKDNSIDVIHCSGVLHHTTDPLAILKEFRRILKPGGFIQVMVYNYDSL